MTMSSNNLTAGHLKKNAYLYVRQSTLKQVLENTESTRRQYALRDRALALGWPLAQIITIDNDLGESGASIADRQGFQKLISEVSLGRAGLIMGLEVSRLARNSADWHRLLEICAFTETLILDEDGIYDPSHFNDRLLLGLKGTMSEAELHVLKARLRGGVLNKVRRGRFKTRLPIGFIYGQNGNVVFDPDGQVQQTVKLLFDVFRRTGAAFGVVKAFWKDQLLFPRRPYNGPNKGDLLWDKLTYGQVQRILKNPRYAGAYYYGRQRSRKHMDGSTSQHTVPREEWIALIPDSHPGYITWNEYEENIRRMKENAIAYGSDQRKTPPREGPCLLQGIAICGKCGNRMTIRYKYRLQGRMDPVYLCQRSRIERGEDNCQYIPGGCIDKTIEELILETMSPLSLEVALEVQNELESRAVEADRLRKQHVERAEYEANLARRRYVRVDPDNRLVADTLEAEWNEKLRELSIAHEQYEKKRRSDSIILTGEERTKVLSLASDFPQLWKDPRTPLREKKRMIRLLIDDVTLTKNDQIIANVRFKGGGQKSLVIPLPPKGWEHAVTDPKVVEQVDELLSHHNYTEIANLLNERGYKSGTNHQFNRKLVGGIRRNYNLKTRYARLRNTGKLTAEEVANLLGVTIQTTRKWGKKGIIRTYPYNDRNGCLYEHPGVNSPLMKKRA
ncbi:recombinase family protein [Thermodesulfobacteriota bacterium]